MLLAFLSRNFLSSSVRLTLKASLKQRSGLINFSQYLSYSDEIFDIDMSGTGIFFKILVGIGAFVFFFAAWIFHTQKEHRPPFLFLSSLVCAGIASLYIALSPHITVNWVGMAFLLSCLSAVYIMSSALLSFHKKKNTTPLDIGADNREDT